MGEPYDAWFSACLGYEAHLVYVGDFKRPVLAGLPSSSSSSSSQAVSSGAARDEGLLAQASSWLSSTF
ncbi:hypothetical protein Micbo1qcDRAFT_169385, partial [Microdochium bolleyi]